MIASLLRISRTRFSACWAGISGQESRTARVMASRRASSWLPLRSIGMSATARLCRASLSLGVSCIGAVIPCTSGRRRGR